MVGNVNDKFDTKKCTEAAERGDLKELRYAHENGWSWNFETCMEAAKNGHLNCLKYAHKHGCEWNHTTTLYAAEYAHLNCLRYARENGCEWDGEMFYVLVDKFARYPNKFYECFWYAREQNCPGSEFYYSDEHGTEIQNYYRLIKEAYEEHRRLARVQSDDFDLENVMSELLDPDSLENIIDDVFDPKNMGTSSIDQMFD